MRGLCLPKQVYSPYLVISILALLVTGCGGQPDRLASAATNTPYPFLTATTKPTDTPVPATTTVTPLPTMTPTHTPVPVIITIEPTLAQTVTPGAATSTPQPTGDIACLEQPQSVFLQVYGIRPDLPVRLGCTTAQDENSAARAWPVQIIYQPMERGHLLWLSNLGWYDGLLVYVMLDDGTYTRYEDTYIDGVDRRSGGPEPPEGLYQPTENLGKIWRIIPGLIERIGFGTEPAVVLDGQMQMFQYGEMVHLPEKGIVFSLWRGTFPGWVGVRFSTTDNTGDSGG